MHCAAPVKAVDEGVVPASSCRYWSYMYFARLARRLFLPYGRKGLKSGAAMVLFGGERIENESMLSDTWIIDVP